MKSPLISEFLTDVLGSTLTVALVLFAFLVLFGKSAEAFEADRLGLEHTPAAKELAEAQITASQELKSLQKDLRLQLEKRLATDIELDFDQLPATPMVSDAGASLNLSESAGDL